MIIINFSHPLIATHLNQVTELLGEKPAQLIERMAQVDHGKPFARQVALLVDSVGLSPNAWQTTPIIVNPPGFAPLAVVLMAELHGRMGHFPTIIRMRPIAGSQATEYEVAELVNLHKVREQAREKRNPDV